MYKVKEPITLRTYGYNAEGTPTEICAEGYILENDITVMCIHDRWLDNAENEYRAVFAEKIIGFSPKNPSENA